MGIITLKEAAGGGIWNTSREAEEMAHGGRALAAESRAKSLSPTTRAEAAMRLLWGWIELRLRGISSIEEVNKVLAGGFVEDLNRRFTIPAVDPQDAHVRIHKRVDLRTTFCFRGNTDGEQRLGGAVLQSILPAASGKKSRYSP